MSRDLSSTLLQSKASDRLYTTGEAAEVLGVSVPTIRMCEREGLIIPDREHSRHRRFSAGGLERIRCLLALIPCWSIRNYPEDERKTEVHFTAARRHAGWNPRNLESARMQKSSFVLSI